MTTIEDFGRNLLDTLDLDPIYVALYRGSLRPDHLKRWLFAYWCFYHAGVASYISDAVGIDFWNRMDEATFNETESPLGARWPRGRERRHFRGEKAIRAVREFRRIPSDGQVESLVESLYRGATRYSQVKHQVERLPMFGPWIAFKVGDMIERVLGVPISFDQAEVFLFDSPRDAAVELYTEMHDGVSCRYDDVAARWSCAYILTQLEGYAAPPRNDRHIGIQEVETILCKWKSHRSGHYPVGNDIREVGHAFAEWSEESPTAKLLSQFAVKETETPVIKETIA